jgi:hypothetical protein
MEAYGGHFSRATREMYGKSAPWLVCSMVPLEYLRRLTANNLSSDTLANDVDRHHQISAKRSIASLITHN